MIRRVIAKPANTQKPTSQSQRKRKKTTFGAPSLIAETAFPIASRQSSVHHPFCCDDDVRLLDPQLGGEPTRRRVVTFADAGAENQDPGSHAVLP